MVRVPANENGISREVPKAVPDVRLVLKMPLAVCKCLVWLLQYLSHIEYSFGDIMMLCGIMPVAIMPLLHVHVRSGRSGPHGAVAAGTGTHTFSVRRYQILRYHILWRAAKLLGGRKFRSLVAVSAQATSSIPPISVKR